MQARRIASSLFTIILLVGLSFCYLNRQNLYDWWVLRSYQPEAEIVKLADDTAMTEKGRRIFYVTKPEIKSASDFRSECTSAEQTIVLGCYKTGSGIYLYDVSDPRLEGIKQVTAAHEMLHAAYDRLSTEERNRIDALTIEQYAKVTDERVRKNVEAYRSRDPSVVPNELHSILGTEVEVLSPELEAHYSAYFTNRQAVVGFSKQYEAEFTKRQAQVEAYDVQLQSLKEKINELNAKLDVLEIRLDEQKKQMDSQKESGDIPSYNAQVPDYNQKIKDFNATAETLRSTIEQHNDIVAKRNALVVEEQELYKAIDTRVPSAR